MKKKIPQKDIFKEDSSSIFKHERYTVWIEAYDQQEMIRRQVLQNTPKSVLELVFDIFHIIKNGMPKDNINDDVDKSEFEKIASVLFRRFELEDLDEQKSVELAITNYIKELQKFEYYVPDNLCEEEFCKKGIDWIANYFKNALKSLRDEEIKFWESLFEKYQERKDDYDVEFRTKEILRKRELDYASRLTPEDFKDLI
ncbi:hypothetical protein LCGC14_2784440 [marine sediment metagenome]|uniref:Uncharacterized protein n=1 Tax=marine sediment metagenome TaxID=412755 RepID=A0A0F8YSB9_9ZZZZ